MNIDEYRHGYEDGVKASKIPGRDIADSIFALVDTASYRKGYKDGLNGYRFNPGELGLFETDDDDNADPDDEIEDESSPGRSTNDHGYSGGYDSSPSPPPPPIPLTLRERIPLILIGVFLIWLDYQLLVCLATECGRIPWRWTVEENSLFILVIPLFVFFILPGGILFWPAVWMIGKKTGQRSG